MNPSRSKGAASWLREVVENSAALVEVMTPEIKHGLVVAREAISLHAERITQWQARARAEGDQVTDAGSPWRARAAAGP